MTVKSNSYSVSCFAFFKLFPISLIAITMSCASGNCRAQKEAENAAKNENKGTITTGGTLGTKPDLKGEIKPDRKTDPKPGSNDPKVTPGSAVPGAISPKDRVSVYKYDGGLQCGMGSATSLDEMQKQLKGIKVHSSINKPDGLMHIQLCGSPTGRCNVYEIDRSSLEEAKRLGFNEWTYE